MINLTTGDLIAGLILAIITGCLAGYVLYRFKIIRERARARNVHKKIERQQKRVLDIGGLKVQKDPRFVIEGVNNQVGEEVKRDQREKEIEKIQENLKNAVKQHKKTAAQLKKERLKNLEKAREKRLENLRKAKKKK